MSANQASQVDLARLFGNVAEVLKENQQSLNESDPYNHNHGDNMVENFQVITQAMQRKKNSTPSQQLSYASAMLQKRSQTGSAQLYSEGLARAADQMRGQSIVTPENAMLLVQSLMGGQSAPAQQDTGGGMGLLGSLLGGQAEPAQGQGSGADLLSGLFGGQESAAQGQETGMDLMSGLLGGQPTASQSQPAAGDLLSGLLGAFMGNAPAEQPAQSQAGQGGGIDLNTLVTAGLAFFQARQQGAAPVAALAQAVMAGSQMQSSAHHSQSGQLVAGTLLNSLASMLSGAH